MFDPELIYDNFNEDKDKDTNSDEEIFTSPEGVYDYVTFLTDFMTGDTSDRCKEDHKHCKLNTIFITSEAVRIMDGFSTHLQNTFFNNISSTWEDMINDRTNEPFDKVSLTPDMLTIKRIYVVLMGTLHVIFHKMEEYAASLRMTIEPSYIYFTDMYALIANINKCMRDVVTDAAKTHLKDVAPNDWWAYIEAMPTHSKVKRLLRFVYSDQFFILRAVLNDDESLKDAYEAIVDGLLETKKETFELKSILELFALDSINIDEVLHQHNYINSGDVERILRRTLVIIHAQNKITNKITWTADGPELDNGSGRGNPGLRPNVKSAHTLLQDLKVPATLSGLLDLMKENSKHIVTALERVLPSKSHHDMRVTDYIDQLDKLNTEENPDHENSEPLAHTMYKLFAVRENWFFHFEYNYFW